MAEQGAQGAPAAAGDWLSGFSAENRGYVENKGWKDPGAMLESYRVLEKVRGVPAERLLKLPEKDDDAAGWGEVYGRLRPGKVEDYGIEGADPELLSKVYEAGLSKRQAQALATYLGERGKAAQAKAAEERGLKAETDLAALRREWGQEYDANIQAGQRAKQALGWNDETLDKLEEALGTRGALELAARIGRGLSEDGFAGPREPQGSTAQPFGMTRSAALAKYSELMGSPEFQKRLMSEDPAVRRAAVNERQRLALVAFPDEEPARVSITA